MTRDDKLFAVAVLAIIAAIFALAVWFADDADAHFTAGCKAAKCKRHVIKPYAAKLHAIHSCETRGLSGSAKWRYDGPSGFDGGFQFHPDTWRRTGSRYAFAHQAPPLEQKYRATVWASRIGWRWRSTAGWPRCG